jgi:hypothetical protein
MRIHQNDSDLYSVESFIELGAELKLDVLDIRTDKGWGSAPGEISGGKSAEVTTDFLTGVKLLALQRGLSIGYLASIGHFTGTPEENAALVAAAKADVDTAVLMGAPLLRCFTSCQGEYDLDVQAREIECFQEICDFAATRGIAIGCQNHPSTGAHMLRIHEKVNRSNFLFVLDTVRKRVFRAIVQYTKTDHFTKTGSGQNRESTQKEVRLLTGSVGGRGEWKSRACRRDHLRVGANLRSLHRPRARQILQGRHR